MRYLDFVNVKMGTDSHERRSRGNTLPLTTLPFGMNGFCLQTDTAARRGWFYDPKCDFAEGVRLTHQPSPWIGDFGCVLMMPEADITSDNAPCAWSGFERESVIESPNLLRVKFFRSECVFELAPTKRCAAIRLSFSGKTPAYLSFLPVLGDYTYTFDKEKSTLYGTSNFTQCGQKEKFCMHFVVKFLGNSVDFDKTKLVGEGKNAAAHIALSSDTCEARIGVSYISASLAEEAILRECGDMDFDSIERAAADIWEEHLRRIEIKTEDMSMMRTFYSCLYRTFIYPSVAYEIDSEGNAVHYSPSDGAVRPGVRYTNNGFWDTARTVYPLFSLIAPLEFEEMLQGFLNDYDECGWLPRWLSIGEIGCMPSTLIDGVFAEAAAHGIGSDGLMERALSAMIHHATNESEDPRFGRNGALSYMKYGYVPRDEQKESVNLTLDAAYGDWCISMIAEKLGKNDIAEKFRKRSLNYKNIFDKETGFMRGRDKEGNMAPDFDPYRWGIEYTEGSAWQNSFFVPHDIEGLASLFGGKDALVARLDELFSAKPTYRVGSYGREIHEMTEMAALKFGQCAISNQPSFHIPFMYAALGKREKTDYWVERMVKEAFSADIGYPGDEDNGSMSAWYIFATIGMYPICPGGELVKSKRLVDEVKIFGKSV